EVSLFTGESFILTLPATVFMQVVAVIVITSSASSVYFYGYQKFTQFLTKSQQRYHISFDGKTADLHIWGPHCAALCVLVGMIIFNGPLLWDLSTLYRGSLDAVVLASIVTTITHIIAWIVLWLGFTLKVKWTFNLRVTVARACVSSARSIKLVSDVELMTTKDIATKTPLLVIGGGKAYAITDQMPAKSIMNVVHKTREEKKNKGQEEEIYWLRPSQPENSLSNASSATKPKVTFQEEENLHSASSKEDLSHSPLLQTETYSKSHALSESEEDVAAGDYAFLHQARPMEPPPPPPLPKQLPPAQTTKQDNLPRYVDRNQIVSFRRVIDELPSPPPLHNHIDALGNLTPRSTRSTDSGMPQEEQQSEQHSEQHSERSDTYSTTSSNTQQFAEISEESGIHSGATDAVLNKSNSDDDLSQLPPDPNLLLNSPRSMSQLYPIGSPGSVKKHPPVIYPANQSTLVINRQKNSALDVKPPEDPIYGTRQLTSFTDKKKEGIYGTRIQGQEGIYGTRSQNSIYGIRNQSQESIYGIRNQAKEGIYGTRNQSQEGIYGTRNQSKEGIYGTRNQYKEGIYGARNQSHEGIYGTKNQSKEGMYDSNTQTKEGIYGSKIKPQEKIYGTRNQVQEKIYGPRVLFSISEQQLHKQGNENEGPKNMLSEGQNNFHSFQSIASSGYNSGANASSSSDISSNSPVPPAMPLQSQNQGIYGNKIQNSKGIYGQIGSRNLSQSTSGIYGRTKAQGIPQAPQIPLPPIPGNNATLPKSQNNHISIYDSVTLQRIPRPPAEQQSIYGTGRRPGPNQVKSFKPHYQVTGGMKYNPDR
ncbi:unnamed protein product, partial [Meganyctiphanes norvegica]